MFALAVALGVGGLMIEFLMIALAIRASKLVPKSVEVAGLCISFGFVFFGLAILVFINSIRGTINMSELWGADTLILLTILAGSFPCVTIDSRGETWAGWHKSPCGQSSWYQGPIKYRLHPMRTLTIFISGHRDLFFATPIQSDNHDSLTFTCDVSVSIRATAGSSPYFFDWDIRTLKSIVSLILIDTLRDTAYRRILPVTDDDLALIRNTFIDKFPTSSIVLISAIVTLTKVSLSWRESGSICNEYTDAKLYP